MCKFDIVSDRKVKSKTIGIRVTEDEKVFLEVLSNLKGFNSISDYVRHLIRNDKEFLDGFAEFEGYKDIVDYINHLEAEEIARLAKERINNIK